MKLIAIFLIIYVLENVSANEDKISVISLTTPLPLYLNFPRRAKTNKPQPSNELKPSKNSNEECLRCSCGIPNDNSRIVGGVETKELQYPWMAMLMYGGHYFCGGSLINDRYILTAAHCVTRFSKYGMTIRLLAHNRIQPTDDSITLNVSDIISHASFYYNDDTYINDIALIKLEKKVDFNNPKLKPICLPCGTLNLENEKGMVIGWGKTSEEGEVAQNLLQVSVSILSNAECEKKMIPIVSDMLCAGEKEGGKDACQGDSGGPLHIIRRNKYYQAGVVSYGDGCARPDTPGVYSKVTKYYRWIRDHTKDACYCY